MNAALSFGMPMAWEWLFILCVVAIVVVAIVTRGKQTNEVRGFPVIPPFPSNVAPGPGRFRVFGVERQSRADIAREYTADSPENARVKGELDGIVVTRVERI